LGGRNVSKLKEHIVVHLKGMGVSTGFACASGYQSPQPLRARLVWPQTELQAPAPHC